MEKNDGQQLKVSAIKDGTVLDHIPSSQVFKVIDILGLSGSEHPVTFGVNLDSKSMGRKGIIKISERFFRDDELNKIALIDPNASVNIIRNFRVAEKKVLAIPETVTGIVRCINPMCVTNHENIPTKFKTIVKGSEIRLLCSYCEKITDI